MDTVETLEGLRRTEGVGREAHPGELTDPVGGSPPGEDTGTNKVNKSCAKKPKQKSSNKIPLELFSTKCHQIHL